MKIQTDSKKKSVLTLKNALELIGFKEIAANVYTIPSAQKLNAHKNNKPAEVN